MTRAIVIIAILCGGLAAAYWQGGSKNREVTIQREKDISDAIKDSDAAPSWRDQLLGRK